MTLEAWKEDTRSLMAFVADVQTKPVSLASFKVDVEMMSLDEQDKTDSASSARPRTRVDVNTRMPVKCLRSSPKEPDIIAVGSTVFSEVHGLVPLLCRSRCPAARGMHPGIPGFGLRRYAPSRRSQSPTPLSLACEPQRHSPRVTRMTPAFRGQGMNEAMILASI